MVEKMEVEKMEVVKEKIWAMLKEFRGAKPKAEDMVSFAKGATMGYWVAFYMNVKECIPEDVVATVIKNIKEVKKIEVDKYINNDMKEAIKNLNNLLNKIKIENERKLTFFKYGVEYMYQTEREKVSWTLKKWEVKKMVAYISSSYLQNDTIENFNKLWENERISEIPDIFSKLFKK